MPWTLIRLCPQTDRTGQSCLDRRKGHLPWPMWPLTTLLIPDAEMASGKTTYGHRLLKLEQLAQADRQNVEILVTSNFSSPGWSWTGICYWKAKYPVVPSLSFVNSSVHVTASPFTSTLGLWVPCIALSIQVQISHLKQWCLDQKCCFDPPLF